MIRVNEQESMEEEKDEEEEVKGTPDPWMVTQAMNTVNPFVRSVEEVASPSKSLKRTEPPVVEPTEKVETIVTPAVSITESQSIPTTISPSVPTTVPPSLPTTSPSIPIAVSTNPTEPEVTTIPVVTGDPETKKRKVDEEISKRRKMSQDYAESERKRSMEMQTTTITTTPQDSDGFAFSDDDDEFDVPDIDI